MFALPPLNAKIKKRSTRILCGGLLSAAMALILVGYTLTSAAMRMSPGGWVLITIAIAQFILIALQTIGKVEPSVTCAVRAPVRRHMTRGCHPPRIGEDY